jgi:hypothetical protein
VHAIWPVTRRLTPKVRVDALIEHFSSPPWDAAWDGAPAGMKNDGRLFSKTAPQCY